MKSTLKYFLTIIVLGTIVTTIEACVIYPQDGYYDSYGDYYSGHGEGYKRLPPGQAKKIYGAKSARDFAPGHNKY